MQALVLVGGEGTRLRPITETIPKPVVPLVDRPFIRFMIDWLERHGVDDIIMACGFLAHGLRDVLGEGGDGGPRLRYVEEPEPLGTAGAIKFAERFLDERFLALNGDVLTDLDLTELIRMHETSGASATLALYPVADPSAYGLVRRSEDSEVLEFLEKPDPGEADTDEVNAGAYVLERSVLDLIPEGREVSIEREVFPRLVGERLYSCRLEGYWMDIGTPERYLQASWDILERRVDTEPGRLLDERDRIVEDGVEMDEQASVGTSILLQAGSRIGAGARIGDRAVIGPACEVGSGARVEGSVLHRGCTLGPGAEAKGAILSAGAEVGERAVLADGCVLGEGARVAPGVSLSPGTKVPPAEEIT
jgi:mannose-1-phosphate guanylyltransferase